MANIIDTLIFDRTQADVDRVAAQKMRILTQGWGSLTADEQAEWLAGMRGAYNASDLNRVGQAVDFIANRFVDIPQELAAYRAQKGVADSPYYIVPYDPTQAVVAPKTDWSGGTQPDTPTDADVAIYLNNLTVLRGILPLPEDAPQVPESLELLSYTTANDIERLLYVIYQALTKIEQEYYSRIDRTAQAFAYAGIYDAGEDWRI